MKSTREKFEELGIDVSRIKDESIGKTICPKCSHTRKHKKDPCLSIDMKKGSYNCWNACGFQGYVNSTPRQDQQTQYPRPKFDNYTEIPQKLLDWFFSRGITQKTLLELNVTHGKEWMPQVNKIRSVIKFNYTRDTELINIKYRDGDKNFKLFKDGELIFYNLNSIKDSTECVIVEGEIDALSWHEAGYKFVISVPNGASGSVDDKMVYLDNCWQYFENKTKIYLATDDDERGRILQAELARRLGIERCFKVDFDGYKDSNELLQAKGCESLVHRLETSREFPVDGLYTINQIYDEVLDIYKNGLPDGDKTGDKRLDEHIRYMFGELTMISGIPSHGKSIFLDQVALKLSINCGWKFGIFSPESFPMAIYFTRLIKRLVGRKFSKNRITEPQLKYISDWLSDRFSMILPKLDEGFNLDAILAKAKILVLRKGIKGLIIDPWNRIEQTKEDNVSERKFIQQQLTKLINFAQLHGVHIFCVAHPTKMSTDEDGNYLVPTLYNISGSADFFNMTQNGMVVYINNRTGATEIHIQKIKWEHLGKKGIVEYNYNEDNSRLLSPGEDPNKPWIDLPEELLPWLEYNETTAGIVRSENWEPEYETPIINLTNWTQLNNEDEPPF